MDFLYKEEKYLYKYADIVELSLKQQYPEPKTHNFIIMAQYNNIVKECVISAIMKIVQIIKTEIKSRLNL